MNLFYQCTLPFGSFNWLFVLMYYRTKKKVDGKHFHLTPFIVNFVLCDFVKDVEQSLIAIKTNLQQICIQQCWVK